MGPSGSRRHEGRWHHGECKTPGGKLVVVDFTLRDGVLTRVQFSGDFFLYPDDALPLLCQAIEGTPATATTDDLTDRLQRTLDGGVELLGASARALAEAVCRALRESADGATGRGAAE